MKINIDIDEKYTEIMVTLQAPDMTDEVTDILGKLKSKKDTTLVGYNQEKMYVLNPKEIQLIYTEGTSVIADIDKKPFTLKNKLYELENLLTDYDFVRISKSVIVNIRKINNIEISFNGSLLVRMNNQKEEIISRRYVPKVKSALGIGGHK